MSDLGRLVLRRIFAHVDDERVRDAAFCVCRAWRAEYRWINPVASVVYAVMCGNNMRLARELWTFCDDLFIKWIVQLGRQGVSSPMLIPFLQCCAGAGICAPFELDCVYTGKNCLEPLHILTYVYASGSIPLTELVVSKLGAQHEREISLHSFTSAVRFRHCDLVRYLLRRFLRAQPLCIAKLLAIATSNMDLAMIGCLAEFCPQWTTVIVEKEHTIVDYALHLLPDDEPSDSKRMQFFMRLLARVESAAKRPYLLVLLDRAQDGRGFDQYDILCIAISKGLPLLVEKLLADCAALDGDYHGYLQHFYFFGKLRWHSASVRSAMEMLFLHPSVPDSRVQCLWDTLFGEAPPSFVCRILALRATTNVATKMPLNNFAS